MSNQTTTVKASKSNFGSKGWFVIIFFVPVHLAAEFTDQRLAKCRN